MSTVIFVSEKIPEKHLVQERIFKIHPDKDIKEKLLEDLKKNINFPVDEYIIDLNIQVSIKKYDKNFTFPDKNQCYQEFLNTKTDV